MLPQAALLSGLIATPMAMSIPRPPAAGAADANPPNTAWCAAPELTQRQKQMNQMFTMIENMHGRMPMNPLKLGKPDVTTVDTYVHVLSTSADLAGGQIAVSSSTVLLLTSHLCFDNMLRPCTAREDQRPNLPPQRALPELRLPLRPQDSQLPEQRHSRGQPQRL